MNDHVPPQKPGHALPADLRAGMERSFHADLSAVRVHEDEHVAAMGARAYARGADLHFAPGRYRPDDAAGRELIGHELAHVVQQAQGRVQPQVQASGLPVNHDAGLEAEADDLGTRAARGELVGGGGARTVATAAPAAPVQGYYDTKDFQADRSFFGGTPNFVTQSPKPTLEPGPRFENTVRKMEPQQTNLRVADDHSMAVNATTDEPKEFYAAEPVLEHANTELAARRSYFKLVATPSTTVTVKGAKLLHVEPALVEPYQSDVKPPPPFAELLSEMCIDLAKRVVGARERPPEMVLSGVGGRVARPIAPKEVDDERVDRLGAYIAEPRGSATPAGAGRAIDTPGERDPHAPELYGIFSGAGIADEDTRALGVNRDARPEVGEAYATFSQRSKLPGQQDTDWTHDGGVPKQRTGTWGYHFAGVIAKSLAGDDRVTLENYRRGADRQVAIEQRFRDCAPALVAKHEAALGTELGRAPTVSELMAAVTRDSSAAEAYNDILKASPPTDTLWFFRMYGTKTGQTFHDTQAASGDFVNPLTIRVRQSLDELRKSKQAQLEQMVGAWYALLKPVKLQSPPAANAIGNLIEGISQFVLTLSYALQDAADHEELLHAVNNQAQSVASYITAMLSAAYMGITNEDVTNDRALVRARIRSKLGFSLVRSAPPPEQVEDLKLLGKVIDAAPPGMS